MKKIVLGAAFFTAFVFFTVKLFTYMGGNAAYKSDEKYVDLVNRVMPTVVDIKVPVIVERLSLNISPEGELTLRKSTASVEITGAGVFISPNGHVLTCAHLFRFQIDGKIRVTRSNGKKLNAVILWKNTKKDLALLKVYTESTPFAILSARALAQGQEVLAIGSPLGLSFSVSHGIVSFVNREKGPVPGLTQSDTFLNGGNSGGPLFNLEGELVGINSCILPPVDAPIFTGLGFSIPPKDIFEFLEPLRGL